MVDAGDTVSFAFSALIVLIFILRLITCCCDKIIQLVAHRITNRLPANHGPHQISTRMDLPPPATHQPPATIYISCASGPHQIHFRTDSSFSIRESWFLNDQYGDLPDLVTYEPQFTSPVASRGPHQSDASINTTPAVHQLQLTTLHRPHQSNLRNDIPFPIEESHFVNRLPRNYGMVDTPSQVHTFRGPYRSNPFSTMTPPPTPPSYMMPSMPREPPRNPSISAFTLASSHETDKGGECTVCLANLQGQDAVVQMPLCSHFFHEKCIRQWLSCQPSCPLCRSPVYSVRYL